MKQHTLHHEDNHAKVNPIDISPAQNQSEFKILVQTDIKVDSAEELFLLQNQTRAMERLISVIQELSLARNLETIMEIVRHAARDLTGADGATFVLKDGDFCYYAEESAISPLWKGKRFPINACVSGWAMLNKQQAVIEDIYSDPRIPADAYRPTFVKSLAMVPIRTRAPIGAIGNYWANRRQPTFEEVRLLQALADSTSVAMENVQVYGELEQRVIERTKQLEFVNKELESFSYSVSHDLRAPLRHISGFGQILLQSHSDQLNDKGKEYLEHICDASKNMTQMVEDLLKLSRVSRNEMKFDNVDLSEMSHKIVEQLKARDEGRNVIVDIEEGVFAKGDKHLLQIALTNLFENAWKYSSKKECSRITFDVEEKEGEIVYCVRDNGAGFDMAYAGKLFGAFQRLHTPKEFEGTGVGLATVERVIHRHGGRIRAEAEVDKGATFYFTLPEQSSADNV